MEEEDAAAVAVPVQVVVRALGVATSRPAGKVSVKLTPLSGIASAAVLAIVKLREAVPFRGMEVAPKATEMPGGVPTTRLADAAFPVPPSLEFTALLVLLKVPGAVPLTLIDNVQDVLVESAALLRLILLVPAMAVALPAQLLTKPFGVEMTRPAGSASLNPTPVSATGLAGGLVTVKVAVVVLFSGMVLAAKLWARTGGPSTDTEAVAVLPVPPSAEVTLTLLLLLPAVVPVTLTLKVQDAPTARVAPDKLITEEPEIADAVPVQVVARLLGVDTIRPAGRASEKATPVSGTGLAAELDRVKARLVSAFSGRVVAVKA
jgi:hypothetical protein